MASVSGGYSKNFVNTPPDDYTCLFCHSVCQDPQQVTCCAKLYCKTCLDQYRKTSLTCPTCHKRMVTFDDKVSNRRIKALKVSCDKEDVGCQWTGELGSLKEHLGKCELVEISCTNGCSEKFLRRDLDNRLMTSCPKRKYECPHYSLEGEHCKITTTHLEECPNVVITCQSTDCDFMTKRSEMENHLAVCEKKRVDCPFAEIGCKETMVRKQLGEHKSEDVQTHLELAVETIATLHNRVKMLEAFKPVVFKVPHFHQLKVTKSKWHSGVFTTHPRGYTMRLTVRVRDDRKGEEPGSYLSVHADISSGEHDDSLVWPFHGSITIQLLNQLEDKDHHSEVIAFGPDDALECTKKPNRGRRNAGWGYKDFISCDSLGYDKESNCQYLMDDCLYLRVYNVTVECLKKPWLTPTN